MGSVTALAAGASRARAGRLECRSDGLGGSRGCASSSGGSGTFPSSVRSACSASARPRSSQRTTRGGWTRPHCAALGAGDGPTIVCAQAGEVNTGAFDPFDEIADAAAEHGAWLHVDGAFGLWAAASPRCATLSRLERADSWITDAHKWLNVPYDSGTRLLRRPGGASRRDEPQRRVSGPGRHARGARQSTGSRVVAARARIRGLRRAAVARTAGLAARRRDVRCARRFADGIAELEGVEVVNEVVLNQVLFRFETDERTDPVLKRCKRRRRLDERDDLDRAPRDSSFRVDWQTTIGDRSRPRGFQDRESVTGPRSGSIDLALEPATEQLFEPAEVATTASRSTPVSTPSPSNR